MSTHNPYTPPGTPVADAAAALPPANKPIAIWLLQMVCALVPVVILVEIGRSFADGRFASTGGIARGAFLFSSLFQLLFAAPFVWTIVAAERRSSVARWLAAILLGGTVLIGVVSVGRPAPDAARSTAMIIGYYLGVSSVLSIPALILYFSSFSKRARAWYATVPDR